MMRFLFFSFFVSCFGLCFSQTSYTNGFNKGYKEGYCHGEIAGCIAPLPPIAPVDIKNDYTTGYNNGFLLGRNEKTKSYQPTGGVNGQLKPYSSRPPVTVDDIEKINQSWQRSNNLKEEKKLNRIYSDKIKNSFKTVNSYGIIKIFKLNRDQISPYFLNEVNIDFLNFKTAETYNEYEFYNGAKNIEDGLYFKIVNPIDGQKNILIIRLSSLNRINILKENLANSGFRYDEKRTLDNGEIVSVYKKDDIGIFITENKNSNGYYQIDVFPIQN